MRELLISVLVLILSVGAITAEGMESTGSGGNGQSTETLTDNTTQLQDSESKDEVKYNKLAKQVKLLFISTIILFTFVFALLAFVILQKLNFRNNVLYILTNRKHKDIRGQSRLRLFKNEIAQMVIAQNSQIISQASKPDENEIKNIVDEYLIQKQEEERKVQQQELQAQMFIQQRKEELLRNSPKSLYADAIVQGNLFNKVQESAVNTETIFELKLLRAVDTEAKVVVYPGAYKRVLANPSFLDGCDVQHSGSNYNNVETVQEGIAHKNNEGKWQLSSKLKVKLS